MPGGKSEWERERLERDEGSSEPDEDVLSQKLSPYTQLHPPSLSLTPSGPWGSQFWSLRLFPLVAPDQLSDFTICKKWLLFKVKFCLQKVHLKQLLPLCLSLSLRFCFWSASLHKRLFHTAAYTFSRSEERFVASCPLSCSESYEERENECFQTA